MSQPLPKYATAARFERSTVDMAADRPILERSDLVLACAHVLHANGQSTHETMQAAERLGLAPAAQVCRKSAIRRSPRSRKWHVLKGVPTMSNSNILGRLVAHGKQSKH